MVIKKTRLAVMLFLSTSYAFAAAPKAPDTTKQPEPKVAMAENQESMGEKLSDANNQILLLQSKLKAAELKAQIATKNQELNRVGGVGENNPTVKSIEGMGHKLHATLVMDNGSKIMVGEGDSLPNGMTVKSINDNAIVLSKGKYTKRLILQSTAFGSSYQQNYMNSQSSGVATNVPLPPSMSMR